MNVSNYHELVEAITAGTSSIDLSNNITIPDDIMLTIPANAEITINFNLCTITGNLTSHPRANWSLIDMKAGSKLTLNDGFIELNGVGDPSYAYSTNVISCYCATLDVNRMGITSNTPNGISSAVDVLTNGNTGDSTATLKETVIVAERYGVRAFGNSKTKTSRVICSDCVFNCQSCGPLLQQASSAPNFSYIDCQLNNTTVRAPRGIYIWDCDTSTGSRDPNIALTLTGSTKSYATITPDPSGDDFYPGLEGEVVVDLSGGQHIGHMKITDNRNTPTPAPTPSKPQRNRDHLTHRHGTEYPKFAVRG